MANAEHFIHRLPIMHMHAACTVEGFKIVKRSRHCPLKLSQPAASTGLHQRAYIPKETGPSPHRPPCPFHAKPLPSPLLKLWLCFLPFSGTVYVYLGEALPLAVSERLFKIGGIECRH